MKGYFKGGIITRIDVMSENEKAKEYLKKYFELNGYNKINNSYLLKEELLINNIENFRNELLNLTENQSDSLENSEAYLLETTADKLLSKNVFLTKDNKKYYFQDYENIKFETDVYEISEKGVHIILSAITILWNTDKIEIENKNNFEKFINNLIRKSVTNVLKNFSWFTITR